jgi:hypothetical protein
MSDKTIAQRTSRFRISLDVWAVASAFALTLLVRVGLLKHIPW